MILFRRRPYWWGLVAVVCVAVYGFWPTEEQRIEKSLRGLAGALEEKNVEEVMAYLSFNYSDNHGASYLLLKKNLERILPEYSDIRIEMDLLSVAVSENTAQVRLGIRASAVHGHDMGYFVGDMDHPAPVTLSMEKHPPGKWVVFKAVYEFQ